MAFDVQRYITLLKRAEQDQSTEVGRMARMILVDPNWIYTAALSSQQTRLTGMVGNYLHQKHGSRHGVGYDASTALPTLLADLYNAAS